MKKTTGFSIEDIAEKDYTDYRWICHKYGIMELPEWQDSSNSAKKRSIKALMRRWYYPGHDAYQSFMMHLAESFTEGWKSGRKYSDTRLYDPRMTSWDKQPDGGKVIADAMVSNMRLYRDGLSRFYDIPDLPDYRHELQDYCKEVMAKYEDMKNLFNRTLNRLLRRLKEFEHRKNGRCLNG